MRNHQGYNAQVMQSITGEENSSIDSKNCIYGSGKNEKAKMTECINQSATKT